MGYFGRNRNPWHADESLGTAYGRLRTSFAMTRRSSGKISNA